MRNITIETTNVIFGKASLVSTVEQERIIKCTNNNIPIGMVRCDISFNYNTSVQNISFPFHFLNLTHDFSEVFFNLDTLYSIPASLLNVTISKELKALVHWVLNKNSIQSVEILGNPLEDSLFVKSLLLPNVCTELASKNIIDTFLVEYSATALIKVTDNSSLVNSDPVSLNGTITFNSLRKSDVTLCSSYILTIPGTVVTYNSSQNYDSLFLVPDPVVILQSQSLPIVTYNSTPEYDFLTIRQLDSNITNQFLEARKTRYNTSYNTFKSLYQAIKIFSAEGVREIFGPLYDTFNVEFEVINTEVFKQFQTIVWIEIGDRISPFGTLHMVAHINSNFNDVDASGITTFGKFDPLLPKTEQFVINDVNGVSIVSSSGILKNFSEFCNQSFVVKNGSTPLYMRSVSKANSSNLGEELTMTRGTFQYHANHNLYKGGVRVGDFDGDGIDDLWCHYPKTTKNFNDLAGENNQIIFDPLERRVLEGDKCSYITTLEEQNWCEDGLVKVGKFNLDKKDDVICIRHVHGYFQFLVLLGEAGGTFLPQQIIKGNYSGWTTDDKILVGDFDGDKYSDLLTFNQTGLNILYRVQNSSFVPRPDTYLSFKNLEDIKRCYYIDINLVYVRDLNGDGRDDILCIDKDGVSDIKIFSQVKGYTSPTNITMIVKDVNLEPINHLQDIQHNNDVRSTQINNSNSFGQRTRLNIEPDFKKNVVQDIYFPFDCMQLQNFNSEVKFTMSDSYSVLESVLLRNGKKSNLHIFDIEFAVQWNNQELNSFSSNKLDFYHLSIVPEIETSAKLINHYITFAVNYHAKVHMYIEDEEGLLREQELKEKARSIVTDFELDVNGDSVIFPIDAHITLNLLGAGYGESSCDGCLN